MEAEAPAAEEIVEMEEEAAPGGGGGGEEIEAAAAPAAEEIGEMEAEAPAAEEIVEMEEEAAPGVGGGGEEIEAAAAPAAKEIGENSLRLAPEKDEYLRYIPLQKAALRGDWETAKNFLNEDVRTGARITPDLQTVLHVAVSSRRSVHFVNELVNLMPTEALELLDNFGCTALHCAACAGNTMAAVILVEKHSRLLYMRDNLSWLPIHWAANKGHKETLLYLLRVTEDDPVCMPFESSSGVDLLYIVVSAKFYDVALSLVSRYPHLARSKQDNGRCALEMMAYAASAFPSGARLNWWERIIYSYVPAKLESYVIQHRDRGDIEDPINNSQVIAQKYNWARFLRVNQKLRVVLWKVLQLIVPRINYIQGQKLMHFQALKLLKCLCEQIRSSNDSETCDSFYKDSIFTATRLGIHEVVEEIVESYPHAVMLNDLENGNIFQLAIINRSENIFNLVYKMSEYRREILPRVDNSRNTILHFVGQLAPPHKLNLLPGAALQMQRELQWFKEVEKFVPHSYKEEPNNENKAPAMIFTEEHAQLVKEGEKWMKDTANSCTIPAALIATIAFAAAITVPGGNNGANGFPIFFKEKAFIIFFVSDAISLFTSTTYLLIFLSILTSRFVEGDFLYVLPKKMIIGFITLYISVFAMIIAFGSTLYLLLGHNRAWILIPIATLIYLPITIFVSLQFPLLVDMTSSTYGRGIFSKQSD